jgi:hypothetical protein
MIRRGALMHAIPAPSAGIARTNGHAHTQLGWHHIQPFRAILSNPMHLPPAAVTILIGHVQHMLHPLKMRWQGTAIVLTRLCRARSRRAVSRWVIRWQRRRFLAKHQRQSRGINPFGALPKACTLDCMDYLFQRRNPSLSRQQGSAQCRYILRLIRGVGGVIRHEEIVADQTAPRQ